MAGLLYHLALVEESWMEVRFSGLPEREPWGGVDWEADPDWEFRTAEGVAPEELRDRYRAACERSRVVVSAASGVDQRSSQPMRDGRHFSLRWVLLHLIEETAATPATPTRSARPSRHGRRVGNRIEESATRVPSTSPVRRAARIVLTRTGLSHARYPDAGPGFPWEPGGWRLLRRSGNTARGSS